MPPLSGVSGCEFSVSPALTPAELLEPILLSLDMRTLLTSALGVCRQWRDLIQGSILLQSAPFLRSEEEPAGSCEVKFNPLLVDLFLILFDFAGVPARVTTVARFWRCGMQMSVCQIPSPISFDAEKGTSPPPKKKRKKENIRKFYLAKSVTPPPPGFRGITRCGLREGLFVIPRPLDSSPSSKLNILCGDCSIGVDQLSLEGCWIPVVYEAWVRRGYLGHKKPKAAKSDTVSCIRKREGWWGMFVTSSNDATSMTILLPQ
jgi:hypothetical protein